MIWRAHTFGPTGLPIPPQAPPALRVEGGVDATIQQRNMAQVVFAQFCTMARLSLGPNPTQAGLLPDGTPYKITTVGPQTIMQIWPAGADDDERRSGIVIALSDLNGDVIDGHHTEGVPTRYLLTPKVTKGTRVPTGVWTVRKLGLPNGGGKAVHANSSGKLYFTGVEGRGEFDYPFNNGRYGSINEYAYNVEDRDNLNMFRRGEKVCVSEDEDAPIPFVLEWTNNERYAAQLVTRSVDSVVSVDLLVGPFNTEPDNPVGPVVDTVSFPFGTTVQRFKISVSKDGRRARTTSSNGTVTCQVTFHITPTSLTVESTNCIPIASLTTWNFEPPLTPPYYNNNFIDTDGIVKPIAGLTGTGTLIQRSGASHVFAFGPRGEEYESITSSARTQQTSINRRYIGGGLLDTGEYYLKLMASSGSTELEDFLGIDSVGSVITEEYNNYVFDYVNNQYSGGGWQISRGFEGFITSIYFNRYLEFAIYIDVLSAAGYQTWEFTNEGGIVAQPTGSGTIPASRTMRVKYKDSILLEYAIGSDPSSFIAYSASDPMTGAIAVNLMQVQRLPSGQNVRLKSWIFLVDDRSVKMLGDVMRGLPDNVCAMENKLLYSL